MKKTVVVGIASGIAAYKSLELIKLLKKEELEVFVVMTENAAKMIPFQEFEKASGNKVFLNLFEKNFDYKKILQTRTVDHIALADKADLMLIIPATANTLAKIAHGIADDFLTTTTLAVTAPIILCPAMNVNMWHNPSVQQNISQLKMLGYQIIEPTEGELACGYEGKGRLEDINIVKKEVMRQLKRIKSLRGKKVIVTAGGTLEKIDEVRYISNKSSGKMGIAIAEECYLRGAEVVLLRANNSVKPRYPISEYTFDTADELFSLMKKSINSADILFHVAAVSDFQVENQIKGKISSDTSYHVALKPQRKILDQIKKLNPNILVIAFKAEYGLTESELIQTAHKRLKECHADAIVANDVSKSDRGFQADTNEVFLIFANGQYKKIPLRSKRDVASAAIDLFIQRLKL